LKQSKNVAEGVVMSPFCHLLIKTGRVDSKPPPEFAALLTEYRSKQQLPQRQVSDQLSVSFKTFQNWERGRSMEDWDQWAVTEFI
jgi:DNA-binding XRE family transcriptional regulator